MTLSTSPDTSKGVTAWEADVDDLVRSVAEWDDRTSPDDYPDHLLITPAELKEFARDVAALSPLPAPEPTEGIAELVGRLNEQCRIEKQRTSAMSLTIAERASANYRDQLCAEAATALTAIQAERDTQDAAIKLVSHSNDSHLEELGRVIMACPQGMRTSPASDGVKQLRAALDRLQAELAAMKEGAAVAWRGVVDGRTAFLCRTNDEVARLAADYDAVIEPLFTHPAPADKGVVECASEDCGQPATRYYAKHGVGSHHCEECYQRIVAIAASPAEGDGR
jgi:hypothetical protein